MFLKIFDKIFPSDVRKLFDRKQNLFYSWKRNYYKSDYQEVFIFAKEEQKIKFAEDLREHSIEFFLFDNSNLIFEAGYKEVLKTNDKFNIKILKDELKMAKCDTEEVEAYINFLISNHIIS